ncbi:protein MpCYP829-like34 [Marchantia polymorpha subsp. ruderalis]|uniref:Cytochrome P450 n=2 Tax=Marchantia polymorpha TaxID=3197 RepID=A0AAF6BPU7_MARPO|nr:hypothetical protein MARPO_0060s0089 [Marchantia polymorpha]BBN14031.1 hypothetical protein Mp_6g08320 [Marchantia polymorpha subsp. ruderalis]|eukprot:PTQ37014.1 hypothetical protein MARPO_0060s0089 [Marchantia polymorpha]
MQLIRNPDKMANLQKELDEVVGRDRPMTEADIPKLSYLEAVIEETLRLHPTIPLLVPRMNEEQTTQGGYDIPKHSSLFVNVWAFSRDPKLWDETETFMHERFLNVPILSETKEGEKDHPLGDQGNAPETKEIPQSRY